MNFREKVGGDSGELETNLDLLHHPIDESLSLHPSKQRSLAEYPELPETPELDEALRNFRSSVHAWSAAELSRVRPVVKAKRQRSWRLAAGWALAGVLVAGGVSGGYYERHQQELRIAAAARLAEQQRVVRELQAREDEEDLLAKVDSDIAQTVPSAMEPLAQLTAEDGTR